MRTDRRGFLFGLPLLGFLVPLLAKWAPRRVPVEWVLEECRRGFIASLRKVAARTDSTRTINWYSAEDGRPIGLKQTGTWIVAEGRFLVNPDAE